MAFFEGTFLWEFSVHSNSGQGAHPTPPPQKKWACSQKSADDFTGGLSVRTIFAQKIPSKIVFVFEVHSTMRSKTKVMFRPFKRVNGTFPQRIRPQKYIVCPGEL